MFSGFSGGGSNPLAPIAAGLALAGDPAAAMVTYAVGEVAKGSNKSNGSTYKSYGYSESSVNKSTIRSTKNENNVQTNNKNKSSTKTNNVNSRNKRKRINRYDSSSSSSSSSSDYSYSSSYSSY